MTTQNISLFQAVGAKMDYLNQRHKLIAQNIANADTPNYRPNDLQKVDFGRVLKNVTKSNDVQVETTSPMHLPPKGQIADPKARASKETYEVAPDKNAVIMEEQLIKSNEVQMDHNTMLNLYRNNIEMLRIANGKRQ